MSEHEGNQHVHLRPITHDIFNDCIQLSVEESQRAFVAPNTYSLAEAFVNPSLRPLAIYEANVRGWEKPNGPMVGFTMYELTAGVGFINRLMIDYRFQGKGFGRSAMIEVIRRLRLHPEVEIIATSHRRENVAASALYRSLGFVDWDIDYARDHPTEVYLRLSGVIERPISKLSESESAMIRRNSDVCGRLNGNKKGQEPKLPPRV